MELRVVFEGPYGFVTDLGGPVIVRRSSDGVELPQYGLPRYGVWRKDRGARKYEVVHVTDDISEARALAENSR